MEVEIINTDEIDHADKSLSGTWSNHDICKLFSIYGADEKRLEAVRNYGVDSDLLETLESSDLVAAGLADNTVSKKILDSFMEYSTSGISPTNALAELTNTKVVYEKCNLRKILLSSKRLL